MAIKDKTKPRRERYITILNDYETMRLDSASELGQKKKVSVNSKLTQIIRYPVKFNFLSFKTFLV